jgi:DNA-binding SARP family transcriptional activator
MGPMRVELLGPLRVLDDSGAEVAVPAGRQRALLARLALEPGRSVSSTALVAAAWADAAPANAQGALHTQLSRLRRLLGDRVATEANGYRLSRVATDVGEFEQLAAQAEAASREDAPTAVRDKAEAALSLWRGPSEFEHHDFAEPALVRLAARREAVAALLSDARLRLEGAEAVLADLAAGHADDPVNEPRAARYRFPGECSGL